MDAEEAAIRRLVAEAQKHQFDVAQLMALHDDDVVVTNMAGRRVVGKKAFADAMEKALSSALRHVPATTEVDSVRFLSPDCALVACTKTVHDERPAAEKTRLPASVGVMTYVVVRKGGRWVIASAQTTPVAG